MIAETAARLSDANAEAHDRVVVNFGRALGGSDRASFDERTDHSDLTTAEC
jgi:hypothetical protein